MSPVPVYYPLDQSITILVSLETLRFDHYFPSHGGLDRVKLNIRYTLRTPSLAALLRIYLVIPTHTSDRCGNSPERSVSSLPAGPSIFLLPVMPSVHPTVPSVCPQVDSRDAYGTAGSQMLVVYGPEIQGFGMPHPQRSTSVVVTKRPEPPCPYPACPACLNPERH